MIRDFLVWNWPFAIAALLMAITALVHLFAGGKEAARPLLKSEGLSQQAIMTLYVAWHMVTVGLFASSLVFLAVALRPEWLAIGWAAGIMIGIWGLVSIVQTIAFKLPILMVPQWMVCLPVAALALWGSMG